MDYKNLLNEKQYEAVSSNEQYLRIIAGAGSGKTRVLTFRISYLIEKMHVFPNQILAITFTNKVAKEMKERTLSLLPNYDLSKLTISTFHAFCARFLRCEIDCLGYPKNFLIYDDDDQMRLVKMIGEDFGYKKTDDNNKNALKYIGFHKMKGDLPSDCENKTDIDQLMVNYFVEYEKRKSEFKALDFDDLIIYTIKILEFYPEIREKWSRRFKHILIDEFQDTNDLQFKLLRLLSNDETAIYVVGDPDQTIYTWRGANQKIILDIDKVYHPMATIILNENYRSTSKILGASNKLIAYNKERVPKELFTNNGTGKDIVFKNFDSSMLEANFVANQIRDIKKKNPEAKNKDFAVLYRSSYLSLKVENALTTAQLPYKVYGGMKFYARKEIKDCLAYFRLLVNDKDNVSFERIINVPKRGFGEKSLDLLKDEAEENGVSYMHYVNNLDTYLSALKPVLKNRLEEMSKIMKETTAKLTENLEAYSEVLNSFLKEIGYFEFLENDEDEDDKIENVHALIDDIRNYLREHQDSNFDEYLQNVALLTSQDDIKGDDSISLMTVHTAKGLEFDYVFVIGLNEGVFPNQRAINERTTFGMEEERRLAYVAFTRAKKELYLTLNRDYSYVLKSSNVPSQFLKEAGLELPSFNPFGINGVSSTNSNDSKDRLYRYDFNKNNTGTGQTNPYARSGSVNRNNTTQVSGGNGIAWNTGDIAVHKVFGEGTVVKVDGDIIEVVFTNFGKKTLLGSHSSLSKKGS